MTFRCPRSAAVLLAGILLVPGILAEPASATTNLAPLTSRFEAVVDRALRQCRVPGAVVGVYSGSQRWARAFGLADVASGRRVRLTDHFAIRSATKSFTVARVLQLVARGRISLDDPISKYYPGVPDGHKVKLRNLANMTSGVFDYTKDSKFIEKFVHNLLQRWTDPELIAFALRHPLNFDPGTQYEYSNTNTLLLGRVIERVTGQRVGPALANSIFEPLGLDDTFYLYGTRIPVPRVLGYEGFEDGRPTEVAASFTALGASGAMTSTLADLRRWGEALVDGTSLPERLQRQRFVARPATNGPEYDRYGLGMGEIDGWWGHTGSGLGFQVAVFHTPGRRDDTIVILLNGSNFNDVPARILRRLIRILETGREGDGGDKLICE
jgi:D-alanyl-D-alanine carboxypeptidase